ncbi:MAG: SpoIIE family protein phosphatase [Bryobacteraceae bacterium]
MNRLSRYQTITLSLLVLAIIGFATQVTSWWWMLWTSLLALHAFRKQLLWRVRNRLLLTFFLFGVVPIFLIGVMLVFSGIPFLGQIAAERAEVDLEVRTATLAAVAQSLSSATARSVPTESLDALRQRVPQISIITRAGGATKVEPMDAVIQAAPAQLKTEFQGLMQLDGKYYLAARAHDPSSIADVLVYVPFDDETRTQLGRGIVEIAAVLGGNEDVSQHVGPDGSSVSVNKSKRPRVFLEVDDAPDGSFEIKRLPQAKGFWDVPIAGILSRTIELADGAVRSSAIVVLSRPSLLLASFAGSQIFSVTMILLAIAGGLLLVVELVSLVLSLWHTRTITRSVHDLYQGTLKVADGDFAYQIPVRGHHQLSDLASSFNGMTAKIQQLIGEVKKKEKLEAELEIARQVQSRLFPRTIPELRTLEMWGTCIPGRFISGDYYDFVKLDDRYTAIALGDVSGKGVSAALLMASIQASLHAQLGFSRTAHAPILSTATLMALIGQQLYESTPAEKYATFFCSVYDDEAGILRYTNAGHLKPILVREGKWSALEGDGMVVGLMPNVTYEQQEIQLLPGDLVAIFSDGIPEAENAEAQEYGESRLAELLVKNATEPLDEIVKTVTDSVDAWAHDPAARDDTTIVVIRRR